MHILMIISSSDPEIKWNAVRFGNNLLNEGDEVTIFLNGPAVDLFKGDSEQFPISEQARVFALSKGGCWWAEGNAWPSTVWMKVNG